MPGAATVMVELSVREARALARAAALLDELFGAAHHASDCPAHGPETVTPLQSGQMRIEAALVAAGVLEAQL